MGTAEGKADKGENEEMIYPTYLGIGGVPQPITATHKKNYPGMPG